MSRTRPLLSAAIVASALLAASLLVDIPGVDATTVSQEAIVGNSFHQKQSAEDEKREVETGVHRLRATPSSGDAFRNGEQQAGTIAFDTVPSTGERLAFVAGEQVTATVEIKSAVFRADALPAAETTDTYTVEWSVSNEFSRSVVTRTISFTADTTLEVPAVSFPIRGPSTTVPTGSEPVLSAHLELPPRFTSAHPTARATIPLLWDVDWGVYGLAAVSDHGGPIAPGETGTVSFRSHPYDVPESLFVRTGEKLTTTVTLPAGVVPGELPGPGYATWEKSERDGIWTVTRMIQVDIDTTLSYNSGTVSFPITVEAAQTASPTVTAVVELPDRFASEQPEASAILDAKQTGFTAVSAGDMHSLAIADNGDTYAWGANGQGQLGRPGVSSAPAPVKVDTPPGVSFVAVSAGVAYSLALGDDGNMYGWGSNEFGQLGTGDTRSASVPTRAVRPDGVAFVAVSAGGVHSLALGDNGTTYAWGSGDSGRLGTGANMSSSTPIPVSAPDGVAFTSVAAGSSFSLATGDDGKTYAWGSNGTGQLGIGSTQDQANAPTEVVLPDGVTFTSVATGIFHSVAIGDDGNAYTWGLIPANGGLSRVPVAVASPTEARITAIGAGRYLTVLGSDDGNVFQLGGGGQGHISPGMVFTSLSVGVDHALAVGQDRAVYSWGNGSFGALGSNNYANRYALLPICSPFGVPAC